MKKLILFIAFIGIIFVSKGQKLEQLKNVTTTTSELNLIHGLTSTHVELNILDGALVNKDELNTLINMNGNIRDTINTRYTKSQADVRYIQKDSVTNFSTAEFQHMIDSTLNAVIHGSFQYGDSTYTAIYTARKTPTGLATGIILDYEFQESTITSAADASGNGHTGTIYSVTSVGNTGFDTDASNLDKAYRFDGTGYYIDAGDNDAFSFTSGTVDTPFSLSSKVKFNNAPGGHHTLIGKTGEYYLERSTSGQARLMIYDHTGTGTYIGKLGTTVLAFATIYEVTATYDGSGNSSGIHIYVNGVDDGGSAVISGTYTYMANTTGLLNVNRFNSTAESSAYISNARVWNVELTSIMASTIYNTGNYFPYTSWE